MAKLDWNVKTFHSPYLYQFTLRYSTFWGINIYPLLQGSSSETQMEAVCNDTYVKHVVCFTKTKNMQFWHTAPRDLGKE